MDDMDVCDGCGEPTNEQAGGRRVRRGMLCARCIASEPETDPRVVFGDIRRRRMGRRISGAADPRVARPN